MVHVVVGDAHKIVLPDLGRHRAGQDRLRGVRLVHTHLDGAPLDRDDLTDLALLRLDYVAALEVLADGLPGRWFGAHVLPSNPEGRLWEVLPPVSAHAALAVDFARFVRELETTLSRAQRLRRVGDAPTAILVQVVTPDEGDADVRMEELRELAVTAGLRAMDELRQHRPRTDPRTCLGKGKLEELTLRSMQLEVDLAVFDQDLSPTQVRSIAEATDLKIIDRTQLILDIFAQRARTREGKQQVELAQLRYRLPRLGQRASTAFSRLAGGIGGRGPGEQKLEIDRRRVKERIHLLERELGRVARSRGVRRALRNRGDVPIVSIVGYTNAGKSTLLNTLTESEVMAEDKLFATLDPTSRRLRFPREREVVVTDTVGFIRDLPPELVRAFRATLEELEDADLLLHVVDVSSPHAEEHLRTVDALLAELNLAGRPVVRVLNKMDRLTDPDELEALADRFDGIPVSAIDRTTLGPLLGEVEQVLWQERGTRI